MFLSVSHEYKKADFHTGFPGKRCFEHVGKLPENVYSGALFTKISGGRPAGLVEQNYL